MEMDITTFNMQRPRAAKVLWQPGVLSMSRQKGPNYWQNYRKLGTENCKIEPHEAIVYET